MVKPRRRLRAQSWEAKAEGTHQTVWRESNRAISGVTNILVIRESPRPKKLVEALEKKVKVINIDILNHMIQGELTLDEIRSLNVNASNKGALVHSTDHQVQHQSQTPTPTEQAKQGTAGPKGDPEVNHNNE